MCFVAEYLSESPSGQDLDVSEELMAEVEAALRESAARPDLRTDLVDSLRRGYGMRHGFLFRASNDAPIPLDAIWIVLLKQAESLRRDGDVMGALGFGFVALVTELDDCSAGHPERERIDALRRRSLAVLDQVGPDVAETRSEPLKGPDINTTRH